MLGAGIKNRDKYLHFTVFVGCHYLSLSWIPASGTQVINCTALLICGGFVL